MTGPSLAAAVDALRTRAQAVDEAARRLAALDPGTGAFGARGPGRLGDLGRELYLGWQRAIDARTREAAAHAERLHATADGVARAGLGYAEADESARRSQREAP